MTKTLNATKTAPKPLTTSARLGFLVRLDYNDDSSNSHKWWDGALQGTTVITRFGRQNTNGQSSEKTFETVEKAAAYYWNLLREKVGKGYHLDAARTLKPNEDITNRNWSNLVPKTWNELGYPDLQGLSPRTAKVGAQVILDLSDPNADEDFLFEAANADPSERFLVPLVLSHPNCPDEAKVMQILITNNALNY